MASQDLHHSIDHVILINNNFDSSDVEQTFSVDMTGFEAVEFLFNSFDGGNSITVTFTPQESDDNIIWTAVDPKFILGNTNLFVDDNSTLERFGYIGEKKFVRALLTASSAGPEKIDVAGMAIRGFPHTMPTPETT